MFQGPWLFPGECIADECIVKANRHRHRSYVEGDHVIVHDPYGKDERGRIETIHVAEPRADRIRRGELDVRPTDVMFYVQGPHIPGDSRSIQYKIRGDLVPQYVSPDRER